MRYLPLYEAKMMNLYDHRFATYEGATGMSLPAVTDAQHDDPSYEPLPRYWVAEEDVEAALGDGWDSEHLFGWRWITASTNERTFVSGFFPEGGAGNSYVAVRSEPGTSIALQSVWSSLMLDFLARQKLSGSNMAYFIVKQFACPPPSTFDATPDWLDQPLSAWLTPRVLELTFTSYALAGLARESGDDGAPFRWVPPRRQQIRAELDAAMFHVFGLDRDEVEHVLGTFTVMNKYDMAEYGDLRTTSLVLTYYDRMAAASHSGESYETTIEPAPGRGPRHESAVQR